MNNGSQQKGGKVVEMRPGGGGRRGMNMVAEKPKNLRKTIGRLLLYMVSKKFVLIALVGAVILSALLNLVGPSLQGKALEFLTPSSQEGGKMTVENGSVIINWHGIAILLVLLAVIYVLSSFFTMIQSRVAARLSQNTVRQMRDDLFAKITRLPIRYLDSHPHGDIMSRITNDIENISGTISQSVSSLISSVITIVGAFSMMLFYSWQMTLISLVTIPLTVLVTTKLTKHIRRYFVRQQKLLGKINAQVEESVSGYKTIVAFNRQGQILHDFNSTSAALKTAGIRSEIFGGVMGPLMNIIGNIGFLLIVICGAYFSVRGIIGISTIYVFVQYSKQFTRPISEVANQYTAIMNAVAGAERVFEILDVPDEIDEGHLSPSTDKVSGNLSFRHIDFSYVPGEPVLKDFCLEVQKGQKIAIVGKTGSGKTTIINLLTRFYETDRGEILLDGTDIRELTKESLRKSIAIVLQDTILFSDTIAAGIRYGQPDASDEAVRNAAVTANADRFIRRLPNGYDTLLTESGAGLSEGQRQLLSIARAVLADPKILILDEATSSVDTRTEMHIQNAMLNLMHGRTTLIIAHRLSTIRDADNIIVLDDGKICEAGNHDALLAKKGVYYRLYMSQFAGVAT